jgi:hypothetical protein
LTPLLRFKPIETYHVVATLLEVLHSPARGRKPWRREYYFKRMRNSAPR